MTIIKYVCIICSGLWKAVRRVFPDLPIHGCHFHWAQSIYRRVQSTGLSSKFRSVVAVKKAVKRVLALPMLPAQHIEEAYNNIVSQNTDSEISELLLYVGWLDYGLIMLTTP